MANTQNVSRSLARGSLHRLVTPFALAAHQWLQPVWIGLCLISNSGNRPKAARTGFCVITGMTAKAMDKVAAQHRAELYYQTHPGSPSAVRMPRLFVRSGIWIALLGSSVREGIAGFGPTIEAALRAFDAQYLNALRPPAEEPPLDRAA
jgi:hypothetical protein